MSFREIVARELQLRQERNRRYSLRRFAEQLGVHHATLSRLLRNKRPASERTVLTLGRALRLPASELESLVLAENDTAILLAIQRPTFRPDSRWLATVSGLPLDRVNVALQSLLRTGDLRMVSRECWTTKE